MTAKAEVLSDRIPLKAIPPVPKIPRLNERVLVGSYQRYELADLAIHAEVVRKCGLTAEVVAIAGSTTKLYAAHRRERNKHD